MFFGVGVSWPGRSYRVSMGAGEMLPGMADDTSEPGRGAALAAPGPPDGAEDRLDHRIDTPPEISATPWTSRRIEQEFFFADALGRPIGLVTARALVCEVLHELGYPVSDDLTDRPWTAPLGVLVDFARTGNLPDPTRLGDAFASLAPLGRDALRFAARLIALEAFLAAVPRTPHAWVAAPGRPGWVDLGGSERELADRLGVPVNDKGLFSHRVLGLTGLGGLTLTDVGIHHVGSIMRAGVGPDEVDLVQAAKDPRARDIWTCRSLAEARSRHGVGFGAYLRSLDHVSSCEYEECYAGPVESVAGFCFGIGMRDGWWLELQSTVTCFGLVGVADLDTERMWDLYAQLGWSILPDDLGGLHLFAPVGWVGPAPSVQVARALMDEMNEAMRGEAAPDDPCDPPDEGPGGWGGPPRFTDPPF